MKAAMRTVKNNAMLYSEAEKLVREATSNDAWGASSTLMCKIADLTTQNEPYMSAMKMMWKRLTDLAYPRHILKSLLLVEFLLRNASERFVLDMQQRIRRFESIAKFSDFKDEPQLTRDVKSRAEAVLRLLNNNEQRQEERLIAQRMRSKMASISNHQNYASSYNGRANQSPNDWTSTDQFSGTRDTGSPNYGDYYQNERENSAFGDSSHRSHSSTPKSKPKKKKKETNAVKQRQTDTNSPTLQSKNEQSSEQDEKKAARRRKRKEAKQAKLKNAEEADITNLNLFSEYDTKTNSDFATQSDGQIFTNNVQSYPVQAKAQADFTTSQSNRIAHNESSANFAHNSGNDFFSSVQPNDEVNASFDDDDDDDDTSNDWLSCTVSTQSLNANCDFFEQQTPPVSTSTFTSATPNDTTLQASNMNSQMGVADTLKHTFDQQHQSNSLASSIQNNAGVIPYPVQPTSSSTTNFVASSHEANNTSKHNDDDDGDIWSITKNLTNLDSITSKSERNDSKHMGNTNEYPKTQQQQAQNYGLEPINLLQSKQQNYSPQISSDGFGLPQWNETNSTQFNTQIHNPHHQQQQQQQPYQQQPFQQQYQHQQYQQQQYQQYQPQQQQQPLQPYQQQQQPLQPYQQQQQQQPLQSYQQQQQQQQMAMSQQHNLYQQSYQPNQHQSYH